MDTKENHQTFINELLLKQNEMISKELNDYLSSLGDKKHKLIRFKDNDKYGLKDYSENIILSA